MDISIIIPALNEENKILFDVEAAATFLSGRCQKGEVIIVDDGSVDRTSETAKTANIPKNIDLHVLKHKTNSGKGASVKSGILAARGEVILFADSGTCIPYINAVNSIERLAAGHLDIAIASRRHKKTVIKRNRPLKRRILSRLFRRLAIWITGFPVWITDSQCGFKIYRRNIARELFSECLTPGYMFEIEIMIRAIKKGLRVEEFPVEWSCDPDTRIRPGAEAFSILKELLKVRSITKKIK